MKKLKRMLAVLLTAIMTLAMATTAFAAAPTGTLTVKVNEKNTLANQTVSIYRLFDLTVSGEDPNKKYAYTVNSKYKNILKELLEGITENSTDDDYYQAVNKIGTSNSPEVQTFADKFTEKLLTAQSPITAENTQKGGEGATSVTFTGIPYGYYLVYQTGTKELQSSLVSVDKASMEITLKGEAPSIEKTADQDADSVEIGQVVTYTITGVIPDTTGYEQYTYKIHDTLTAGLDFVTDANGTALNESATTLEVSVQIQGEQKEKKNATLGDTNKREMTLNLSDWVREKQTNHKGKSFTVTYYAKVNEKAVVTEKNSASLEYGNDPQNTTTTTPSEAETPTYPLDINKTDTNNKMLADATFRLYRNEEDAKAANDKAIKVTGKNGSYTVAVDQKTEQNMDMTTIATKVEEGYNLHLNGLAAGTYWLVETEAPAGYNKLTEPIKITIKQNEGNKLEWTVNKDDVKEDDKIIDIKNTTGTILPGTGGMGTVLFTVIGVALVLIIAASFVISRRKRAE